MVEAQGNRPGVQHGGSGRCCATFQYPLISCVQLEGLWREGVCGGEGRKGEKCRDVERDVEREECGEGGVWRGGVWRGM